MNRLLLLGIPALLVACADGTTPTQPASQAASYSGQPSFAVEADLFSAKNKNWRVYNVEPATNSFWDINKAQSDVDGGVLFPFQTFLTTSTGSFAVYLLNNYNVDMTGNTITSTMSWDPGTYKTRSEVCSGAYVRLEFQDVAAGPYDSNDYWWSTGSLDLNTASTSGQLLASLKDRTAWINQSGKLADDNETNWVEWQRDTVAMSPYDGFTKAVKNVKQVGLSFGSSCTYASGVAVMGTPASFHMTSFTVTTP